MKRFRAIIVTAAMIWATNFAISYSSRNTDNEDTLTLKSATSQNTPPRPKSATSQNTPPRP